MIELIKLTKQLGIHRSVLEKMARDNKIPGAELIGERIWLVPESWANEWLERRKKRLEPPEGFELIQGEHVKSKVVIKEISTGKLYLWDGRAKYKMPE